MLLSKITGKSKQIYKYKGSDEFVIPTQYIGVEIELEKCKVGYNYPAKFNTYWTMKEDGSLRHAGNGLMGVEYTFKDALFGLDAVEALNSMEEVMKDMKPDPSWRCGLHVHVDTSDLNVETLFNYIFLYMLFESALYKFAGDERKDSPFCVPLTTHTDSTDKLVSILKIMHSEYTEGDKAGKLARAFEGWNKYNGMNLAPLLRFGTIEFRQAPSTYDATRIKKWINLLLGLKAAAQSIDTRFTTEFHRYISQTGVQQLARIVFGHNLDDILYNTFYEDVAENINFIQHILVSMKRETITTSIRRKTPKLGLSDKMAALVNAELPKPSKKLGDRMLRTSRPPAVDSWDLEPE